MRPTVMDEAERQLRLQASTSGLADRVPLVSARDLVSKGQRNLVIGIVFLIAVGLVFSLQMTLTVVIAFFTMVYVIAVTYRVVLFMRSSKSDSVEIVSDEEALSVPEVDLPSYTVMIPAYREVSIISKLIHNIAQIDYPVDRLEVVLLIEEDDEETLEVLRDSDPGLQFKLVLVPAGEPRTKPKALNYGLTHATGTFLTIFDAEDRPDPLQLRRAAIALSRLPPEVACLQARLGFFNGGQNVITRWFQVEYSMWFRQMLPGLSKLRVPIPLGGTSNHFRKEVLLDLGAWDPYNVTEDADLGVRLSRAGYRSEVMDSLTLEEANSDFVNWAKQRSRGYKGYLQTFLVHMRDFRESQRLLGTRRLLFLMLFVGGTPLMAMVNPIFWTLTVVWFVVKPAWLMAVFPAPLYFLGLFCWLAGNFLFTFTCMLEAIEVDDSLFVAALLTPVYWVMMSVAAYKALVQVFFAPAYWEKTRHGLAKAVVGATAPARPTP
jgi:cellulose synthase/poly-beta-1,6-N-acetylglucosamine synthase-like glycosyltransferase